MFSLKDVPDLYVYAYHYIDDRQFIRAPAQVDPLLHFDHEEVVHLVAAVGEHLKSHGWKGDGEIGLIWLPPFLFTGDGTSRGVYVWHVKQSENGTSYLGSPVELPFPALERHSAFVERRGPRARR
jgi:hypothetical protein